MEYALINVEGVLIVGRGVVQLKTGESVCGSLINLYSHLRLQSPLRDLRCVCYTRVTVNFQDHSTFEDYLRGKRGLGLVL